MKKILAILITFVLVLSLSSCKKDEYTISVGATPSPHAEILKCDAVQEYVKSKGCTLDVKVYQDWKTLNKALDDYGIDANYFQHEKYLKDDINTYGFKLSNACEVHNEPLNLYGKSEITDWTNAKIYIVNDQTNVERAYQLLLTNGIIDSYDMENFNSLHPKYTSSKNVQIECLDPGLLHNKVNEGEYAVIPGNYALNAWGTEKAISYKILGETTEAALPNIIAVRTEDLNSEKTKILVEALSQPAVKTYIEEHYGPTVNYCYKSLIA